MQKLKKVIRELFCLAKGYFLPVILFWGAVFLMQFLPFGGLATISFINAEIAVRFWIESGYSYLFAFIVCTIAGNIDLAVWFWTARRGRHLLEKVYPGAGKWFAANMDPQRYEIKLDDSALKKCSKWISRSIFNVFKAYPRSGLVLAGAIPFCGPIVGVPSAIGYKIKHAYLLTALGNTVKIILFGYIISHNVLLFSFSVLFILIVIFSHFKLKPRSYS